MNFDGLRLELADARVRIATLERLVAHQGDAVARLADLVERLALPRIERAGEVAGKHDQIRALAGFFEASNIEALARRIERACGPECAVPPGAEEIVARLRAGYGRGGPSRATVRRALAEFSRADDNACETACWGHFNRT
jgi:uncharacterized coiled-coil protein SlyX